MTVVTRFPTTRANGSYTPLTNPTNAFADDGVFATGQSTDNGTVDTPTDQVYGSFGFDGVLPTGCYIKAVKVIIQSRRSALSANATATATASYPIVLGVPQTIRFGVHTDSVEQTWALNHTADRVWTRADLLDTALTLWVLFANDTNDATLATADWEMDYVKIEVEYEEGAGHAFQENAFQGDGFQVGHFPPASGRMSMAYLIQNRPLSAPRPGYQPLTTWLGWAGLDAQGEFPFNPWPQPDGT